MTNLGSNSINLFEAISERVVSATGTLLLYVGRTNTPAAIRMVLKCEVECRALIVEAELTAASKPVKSQEDLAALESILVLRETWAVLDHSAKDVCLCTVD